MKTTKFNVLIALLFLLPAAISSAQEYKIAVQNSRDTRVVLKDFSGGLPIEGYSGNEIIITSTSGRHEPPEKAKGLKPVFPGGTDNTGIGVDVQKTDKLITITCLVPFTQRSGYKLRIPENLAVELSSGCERSNNISLTGMKNEIDIKNCHNVELKNVTGPLVLSTISGNIDITYSAVDASRESSIASVSGDIDISLPVKAALNIELGTISGAIYSDFDFSGSSKDLKQIGGSKLTYPLNGGGSRFYIKTVSGNIYLRKGN